MFSFSEFFLIIIVACLVLGPNSLKKLPRQLAMVLKKRSELLSQLQECWHILQKEEYLEENNKRARKIDACYKKK